MGAIRADDFRFSVVRQHSTSTHDPECARARDRIGVRTVTSTGGSRKDQMLSEYDDWMQSTRPPSPQADEPAVGRENPDEIRLMARRRRAKRSRQVHGFQR